MSFPELTIANLGAVLRGCGVPDEMVALAGMCGDNHTAGFVLRHLVGMGAGTREVFHTLAQWEKKTVKRRKLETACEILRGLGVSIEIKPLNGDVMRPVSYYTIDAGIFWQALGVHLESIGIMYETYIRECTKRTSASVQNVHPRMDESASLTLEESKTLESKSLNLSSAGGEASEVPQPSQTIERERFLLDPHAERLDLLNYEKHRDALNKMVFRHTLTGVLNTVEKCKSEGAVDWVYIFNRLNRGGAVAPSPSSAAPPSPSGWASSSDELPASSPKPSVVCVASVEAVRAWGLAYGQLSAQFDRSTFETWLAGAELRDERDGVFYVVARNHQAVEALQKRLYRRIKNVLSDVVGFECSIVFEAGESVREGVG